MKKYHVYGIGAALVDTEIEVTDDALASLGVEKGLMTLVDEARQAEIVEQLAGQLVHSKRASGGSAGNSIIAVSYFGGRTFFSGKVASDDNGAFYLQDMADAGTQTIPASSDAGVTGKCLILITPDAERSMNTFLGISETLSTNELDEAAIADSEYLYLESYLVTSPSGLLAAKTAAQLARKAGTKVALSFSDPGIVEHFRDGIADIIGEGVDLVFCNQDEALSFAQTQDLQAAIETIKTVASEFVVTRSADGAVVYDGATLHTIDGVKVEAVDTNGAGDMFAGAFLYGITHGMDRRTAGQFASASAAHVVTQYGPRLSGDEYRQLRAQWD